MLNPANSLSLLRAPLALLFIIDSTPIRIIVVILAMLTDCVDGYLARRYQYMSRLGAILDPLMDKFFVYVALAVLLYESQMAPWQAATMLTRDFSLFVFMLYLGITGSWRNLEFKSIRWGKVTTAFQFMILSVLVLKIPFPPAFYYAFILFGALAFVELLQLSKKAPST